MPLLSWRRRAVFLALPYLAFALLLIGAEILVRTLAPPISTLQVFVTAPEQQAQFDDRFRERIVEGDPLLFWRLRKHLDQAPWDLTLVSTNAQGLRYDHDLRAKPRGGFRVVCLGDSVTFGYRVPFVSPRGREFDPEEKPYPALIEGWLRAQNPGRLVEVVPLAVPGYSSHQGLAWLRQSLEWLEPDLVTVCFGWNDVGLRSRSDHEVMTTDWLHVNARRLVSSSQGLLHLTSWVGRWHAAPASGAASATVMRVPEDRYLANILEIARLARAHGAVVVVIGPVYRDRVSYPPEAERIALHRGALRRAMRIAGVPYLEVPELTEAGFPANRGLFSEHIHPNAEGHRHLAHALLDLLSAQGMLAASSLVAGESR